jgi:hypothetical protein
MNPLVTEVAMDYVIGCVHRENYSVTEALHLDLETEAPDGRTVYDGPRYRTGPAGFVIFTHERHEQGFQAWYRTEHGAAHRDPCQQRPAWMRSSLMAPGLP